MLLIDKTLCSLVSVSAVVSLSKYNFGLEYNLKYIYMFIYECVFVYINTYIFIYIYLCIYYGMEKNAYNYNRHFSTNV